MIHNKGLRSISLHNCCILKLGLLGFPKMRRGLIRKNYIFDIFKLRGKNAPIISAHHHAVRGLCGIAAEAGLSAIPVFSVAPSVRHTHHPYSFTRMTPLSPNCISPPPPSSIAPGNRQPQIETVPLLDDGWFVPSLKWMMERHHTLHPQ